MSEVVLLHRVATLLYVPDRYTYGCVHPIRTLHTCTQPTHITAHPFMHTHIQMYTIWAAQNTNTNIKQKLINE